MGALAKLYSRTRRALKRKVIEKKGTQCHWCGEQTVISQDVTARQLTIDHVIPAKDGGTNSLDNLVPCCFRCNQSRAGKNVRKLR